MAGFRDDAAARAAHNFADMVDDTLADRMDDNNDFMQAYQALFRQIDALQSELGSLADTANLQELYFYAGDLEAKAIECGKLYMYLEDMLARLQRIMEPIKREDELLVAEIQDLAR